MDYVRDSDYDCSELAGDENFNNDIMRGSCFFITKRTKNTKKNYSLITIFVPFVIFVVKFSL